MHYLFMKVKNVFSLAFECRNRNTKSKAIDVDETYAIMEDVLK